MCIQRVRMGLRSRLAAACLAFTIPVAALAEKRLAPETRAEELTETLHGVEIPDPYRWLEDQKAPQTRAWIDEQNKHTDSILGILPEREALKKRLTELLRIEVLETPTEKNGRYFYRRRRADQDLQVICMRQGAKGVEEVLVDPHPLSADKRTSVVIQDISEDGTLIAYGIRQGGEDELTIKLLDVNSRKELPDVLPRARYAGVSIQPDARGLYYSKRTEEGPRVFHHAMGRDPGEDKKLFGDGYGPEKLIGVGLSDDGRYLAIVVFHGSAPKKTEVYAQDLARKGAIFPVVNDIEARFSPQIAGNRMFLHTNWEAPRGRVLAVDLDNPSRERWKEIVPQGSAAIQSISAAGGKLFVRYLENVVSRIKMFDSSGRPEREISFPSIGTVGGIQGEWRKNEAFFTFASFHIPTTIYRYDVAKGSKTVWARQEVPIETNRFEVRQVKYASKDGTQIPMFLVHPKGLRPDGSHPTLLTGYGGFTASQTPSFSARAAAWVENGGVYALPNLRGGGEFGEEWHEAGMLAKKQNVFDDFIAAAEWLIANKYTSPGRLAISGGSNGGLLVGAALTQRPDLFGAVVCSYPLLDMVRYHRFLVARYWVPEYGSAENAEQFRYLRAYSPYHNVRAGAKYPAVLFITGDSDTRVDPLHARKMAALLQTANASERPILLHYDTKAGHSGGTPVSKTIEDLTDELSFLFSETGGQFRPAAAQPKKKAA